MLGGLNRCQASAGQQAGEPLGPAHPGRAGCLAFGELPVDLGEPVSAVTG